jgi:predicted RND superfamily exporter protein
MFTDLAMLVGFGVASAIGVLAALVYTLVLLPPTLVVVPIRARSNPSYRRSAISVDLLVRFGVWCANNRRTVIGAWGIVAAVTFSHAVQLRFEHNPVEWFGPESVARTDVETISERMKMGNFLELVVDSGEEDGLYEPALMRVLDDVRERLETRSSMGIVAGRAISVVDVLKETHRALNENQPDEFTVPRARDLIAQELLLFEMSGSGEIDSRVDKSYRKARVTTLLPLADAFDLRMYLKETTKRLRDILGESATLTVTGQGHLDVRALTALISSMGKSYILALVLLVPLMMLLTGDFRLGMLSLIPNMVPIAVGLGLMRACDIPLDMFTMMSGCIAIGIAVDDTIHFVHNFARNFEKTGDVETAVRQTLRSTGRALFLTSIVLASSFCVFGAASLVVVQGFGVVTAAVIVAAFVADVSLTPALVTFVPRPEVPDVRSVPNPLREGALLTAGARSVSAETRAS